MRNNKTDAEYDREMRTLVLRISKVCEGENLFKVATAAVCIAAFAVMELDRRKTGTLKKDLQVLKNFLDDTATGKGPRPVFQHETH
jgi:hypothetical protein